jgi:hypothetical protein
VVQLDGLVGGPTTWVHLRGSEAGVVAVGRGTVSCAALEDLGNNVLPDPRDAESGVEQSSETLPLISDRRAHVRVEVWRVPLAVGREPPISVLEVVVQRDTPSSVPRSSGGNQPVDRRHIRPDKQA